MATNNNCTNCNKCGTNAKCGCTDSYLTTPLPCPTPVACPAAQICSETFDSQCITYTGASIICNGVTVINTGDNVHVALNSIIEYFCTVIDNLPTVTLVAGEGINITETVVDNNTEYTISTTGVKKYIQSFDDVEFDNITLTVLGTDLAACGLITLGCGGDAPELKLADFTYNIMFFDPISSKWISLMNEPSLLVTADIVTEDISFYINSGAGASFTVRITIIG